MGNLRSKYTEEEWSKKLDEIDNEEKISDDITIFLWDKNKDELITLKERLEGVIDEYELNLIDKWINKK